ncbi:MAG: hypothetical protein HY729_05155 [Candidatus Rokubacteria bacterium]|nr:hypothetical protein [Candidatus Rokubacteria bacterium]
MAKLIQVSTDAEGRTFIGVDADGEVWRGQMQRDQSEEYILWKRIRSEFERRG